MPGKYKYDWVSSDQNAERTKSPTLWIYYVMSPHQSSKVPIDPTSL